MTMLLWIMSLIQIDCHYQAAAMDVPTLAAVCALRFYPCS